MEKEHKHTQKPPYKRRKAKCLKCEHEWHARNGNEKKPSKCPACGTRCVVWKSEFTPDLLMNEETTKPNQPEPVPEPEPETNVEQLLAELNTRPEPAPEPEEPDNTNPDEDCTGEPGDTNLENPPKFNSFTVHPALAMIVLVLILGIAAALYFRKNRNQHNRRRTENPAPQTQTQNDDQKPKPRVTDRPVIAHYANYTR